MTRCHDRARFGPVYTLRVLVGSAFAATRQPVPAPRHARHETPWSPR